jgi:hypothetical protein
LLESAQVTAAYRQVRRLLEPVELQIDVRAQRRKFGDEPRILGEPDPVRVDHHPADPALLGHRHELDDVGVDRWLAARELDYLRAALGGNEGVEHEGHLLACE